MSKRDKRAERIRRNINNVSLADFEALIREHGFIKESGKHPKARIGNYTMPYKKESTVKTCYVKELLRIIDSL